MQPTLGLLGRISVIVMAVGIGRETVDTQTSTVGDGLRASIFVRTVPNWRSRSPGGSGTGDDMLPGESSRLNLAVGGPGGLCAGSAWGYADARSAPSSFEVQVKQTAQYIWQFDVTLVEVVNDRITFDLVWQRTSRTAPNEVLRQQQRLTLGEGESLPIDLLHGASGSDCVSVAVEVTASIVEDPAHQDKTIEWNVWLNDSASGTTERRALTSLHGESATFSFDPLSSTATQLNGTVDDVWVRVYGMLRGRVRVDGSINVAVSTERAVGVDRTLSRGWGPRGGSGQKHFTVKAGEAVKIVLPPLGLPGSLQVRTDPVTGRKTLESATSSRPPAGETSLTVLARVR